MSKKDSAPQDGLLSPYLSLRAAVRPAAMAYAVLTREQDHAGVLVKEAEVLLKTTRDLLETGGLVHILSPGREPEIRDSDGTDDQLAEVLSAYAEAGMLWAKILGSSVILAEALARDCRADEAKRWVVALSSAGEADIAKDLTARIQSVSIARLSDEVEALHPRMTPEEIEEFIKMTERIIREIEKHVHLKHLRGRLAPLALSIFSYHGSSSGFYLTAEIAKGSASSLYSTRDIFRELAGTYSAVKAAKLK